MFVLDKERRQRGVERDGKSGFLLERELFLYARRGADSLHIPVCFLSDRCFYTGSTLM